MCDNIIFIEEITIVLRYIAMWAITHLIFIKQHLMYTTDFSPLEVLRHYQI